MSAIDLAGVMDGIKATLESEGVTKRAYEWPTESVNPPCAVVGYPTTLEFDTVFQRGGDRAVIPVWILVGKVSDRTARDELSTLITGATGVKDALDGDLGGACQTARVTDCTVETVAIAGVNYLSARFDVEVYS